MAGLAAYLFAAEEAMAKVGEDEVATGALDMIAPGPAEQAA